MNVNVVYSDDGFAIRWADGAWDRYRYKDGPDSRRDALIDSQGVEWSQNSTASWFQLTNLRNGSMIDCFLQ